MFALCRLTRWWVCAATLTRIAARRSRLTSAGLSRQQRRRECQQHGSGRLRFRRGTAAAVTAGSGGKVHSTEGPKGKPGSSVIACTKWKLSSKLRITLLLQQRSPPLHAAGALWVARGVSPHPPPCWQQQCAATASTTIVLGGVCHSGRLPVLKQGVVVGLRCLQASVTMARLEVHHGHRCLQAATPKQPLPASTQAFCRAAAALLAVGGK